MPRPRYAADDVQARERIIEGFWAMLAEVPYQSMRVLELCRRVGVNKNTFYYHFENLDALAREAIARELPREFAGAIVGSPATGLADAERLVRSPALAGKLGRMGVALSPNAAALRDDVLDAVEGVWVQALGLRNPSEYQRRMLHYFSGGLANVLSHERPEDYARALSSMLEAPFVASCVAELRSWGGPARA